jgi:hypothetical protein
MHADRTNRAILSLFALLLIAVGLIAALISFGAFGVPAAQAPLLDNPVRFYVGRQGAWLWPVIAVAAAVLALLAARWLTALLFSTDRVGQIRIATDTTLLATALTDAVAEEIKTYPGVHSAKARLVGDPTIPELVISASLHLDADVRALRHRIEANAVTHARQALDKPNLRVILDLTITASHGHTLS